MRMLRWLAMATVFLCLMAMGWAAVDLTRSPPVEPISPIELDVRARDDSRPDPEERGGDRGDPGGRSPGASPVPPPPPPPAGVGADDDDDDDGGTDD